MDTTEHRADDAAAPTSGQTPRVTWVRHAPADDESATHPDVVTGVTHYDDRVSADHPEDRVRYLALLAARASRCAAVEELDASTHDD